MEQYRTREHKPAEILVTLDRTLSYKKHTHNTKRKVATRNHILWKLANSKLGTSASTIRTTAVALCYSVAEYTAPVWARSHHAHVRDSEHNTACRAITGLPTNVEDLFLLAETAPPDIRRDVCARVEKKKQKSNLAHSLYCQTSTESRRLKSRSCFLSSVRPVDFHPKVIRCNEWQRRLNTKPHRCSANLTDTDYVHALRAVRNSGSMGATMCCILQFDSSLLLFKSDSFLLCKCEQTEYVVYQTPTIDSE